MKKSVLLVIGIGLVGAAPPATQSFGWSAPEAKGGYPPCSKTVTDRCIQLYERGVRSEANLARNAGAAPAAAAVARIVPAGDEDIDVAYAGNTLQAPRSGHHPGQHAMPRHPAPQRVVIVRQHPRAHAVHPQAVAHAAAAHRAYPACGAGIADQCRQQRHRAPSRQLSMRVRRAGERG